MRAILVAALLTAPLPTLAQQAVDPWDVGDVWAGQAFARDLCAECHYVEPEPPTTLGTDIKPFREVAADPKMTEMALRVFLQSPHQQMPDFLLTKAQTDNVIAYILSLREFE